MYGFCYSNASGTSARCRIIAKPYKTQYVNCVNSVLDVSRSTLSASADYNEWTPATARHEGFLQETSVLNYDFGCPSQLYKRFPTLDIVGSPRLMMCTSEGPTSRYQQSIRKWPDRVSLRGSSLGRRIAIERLLLCVRYKI